MAPQDVPRARAPRPVLLALLTCSLGGAAPAGAGHESAFYPSFYPQEIRIAAMDPAAAAAALRQNALQAYVGPEPFPGGPAPAHIRSAESFGSYVVATWNPASPAGRDARERCAVARALPRPLAEAEGSFVPFPYPVTPYHPDYLQHFDRARQWVGGPGRQGAAGAAGLPAGLRVVPRGGLAERLVAGRWPAPDGEWDLAVEEVDLAGLAAGSGPPWMRQGWFHAWEVLAGTVPEGRRRKLEAAYRRLTEGAYAGEAEKIALARSLVAGLARGCERVILGYTTRRVFLNDDFTHGVENVAVDALGGALAPIFVRTVKLKEFPWNGLLRVAVAGRPAAAWNPVGGFSDPAGRLLWSALGDFALLPAPAGGSWIPARAEAAVTPAGTAGWRVEIPPDALVPDPAGGPFRRAGAGHTARARVVYKIPASRFHDGTRMTVADLIYPYAFAHRWGGRRQGGGGPDPAVEASTALLRRWLLAFRIGKPERIARQLADVKLEWEVPVVEVYLRHATLDPRQAAAAAPPWSSVPWHLTVLMEEAVARGAAAFSAGAARRLGVPWLDLARDPALQARLAGWAEQFERAGHVPDALKGLVTPEEARGRWAALRGFLRKHRHLLITSGPYRLEAWGAEGITLQVFRDPSYPLGVGSFDGHVLPPRARITRVELQPSALRLAVEMEKAEKAQRSIRWVREDLRRDAMAGGYPVQARCRYVVLAADGRVQRAGEGQQAADGTFRVDLRGLSRGTYTVLAAVYLNGNAVHPDVRAIPYRVPQ